MLTEALTRLPQAGLDRGLVGDGMRFFGSEGLLFLGYVIAAINAWNRLMAFASASGNSYGAGDV